MKHKKIIILAVCTGILLATTGCLNQRPPLKIAETDKPIKVVRAEDLILTARFLDDETLEAKFGDKTNPFISDYSSLQFRRFMAFELSIKNAGSAPVMFELNRLEVQFGGMILHAYNRFRINQYWDFKEDKDNVKGIYKARRERFVKDNVLPDSIKIPAPGELKGFAVFAGSTPEYGTATMYVPLFGEDGRVVHRFEVSFEY